jgi:hypothetical protein
VNSNGGNALVRPLIGLAAAVILIISFFLPWLTWAGLASVSLMDMASKSSGQGWLTLGLLIGGAILAAVASGLRAAGNSAGTTSRRTLAVFWVVGFAMALGGFALYLIDLNQYTTASYYGYSYSTGIGAGFGVWLGAAAAVVGLIGGLIDLAIPGQQAWVAPYGAQPSGAQPSGAQPYGAPGYGPSAQDAWATPQAPTQVYSPSAGYAAAATAGRLTYVESGQASTLMVNPGEQLLVGRDTAARLRLSDPKVSRQHAMISRSGNDWVVRDMGATNPTRLIGAGGGGGQAIQGEVRVPSGQLLIGDVLVTLYPA